MKTVDSLFMLIFLCIQCVHIRNITNELSLIFKNMLVLCDFIMIPLFNII